MQFVQLFRSSVVSKWSCFAAFTFILLCSAIPSQKAVVDFSGEWKLNEQKSELGQFGERMAARKMKVTSRTDSLLFERNVLSPAGEEITSKVKISFDGKESESTLFENAKRKSAAKWSEDGQSLQVNSTILLDRNGETIEIKVQETWKLMDNGNNLAIESHSTSSFGENTMKLVYDRVK